LAINITSQEILKRFYGVPVVLTPGNNDFYPRYSVNTSITSWLKVLGNIWQPFFPDSTARSTFEEGGWYSYKVNSKLEVLSLNTILFSPNYATFPPPSPALQFTQFSWLESKLQANKLSNTRVYIIGHIPPGTVEWHSELQWHKEYIDKYTSIIEAYSDIISMQIYGHTHRDDFKVQTTQQGNLVSYLVVPSVSPVQLTNPAFRTIIFNTTTYNPIDYLQFYTDIYAAKDLTWKLEYDFDKAYGQYSVDSASLLSVFRTLQSNPEMFALYAARYASLYNPDKGRFLCAINNINRQDYENCVQQLPPDQNKVGLTK